MSYIRYMTNVKVRDRKEQTPVSALVSERRLHFFEHVARSDSDEDYHRAVNAAIGLPQNTRRDPEGGQGQCGCAQYKTI